MPPHYQIIGLNCRYSHSSLSLFYVRQAIETRLPGSTVSLQQFTINDPYYDTLLQLTSARADALFISVYVWNAQFVRRLIRDLAELEPPAPIILGGPQAPFLGRLPENCTVVTGEVEGLGDSFFVDLAEGNLRQQYRGGIGNEFSSPYLDTDFSTHLHNRQVYYESSRGCPFHCSYCLSSVSRSLRHRDLEDVTRELEQLLHHEPAIIKFVDRTFNDVPERALRIWQFLAGRKEKTRFHFEIAPDRFTGEMFAFLETVDEGRFQFEIGLQSFSPAVLAAVNRSMEVERAEENIRRLVRLDTIHLHVDLILGLPYETPESFGEGVNRVFSLRPHYIQMGLLKVLPETLIHRDAGQHGLVFCGQPPFEILATRWLDHATLARLYRLGECIESFYNNRYFRLLWEYLHETGENSLLFFQGLLTTCEANRFFDLSHTQEFLCRMLVVFCASRKDGDFLHGLLRFEWLRCGHRFLPDFLEAEPLTATRKALRQELPPSIQGLYDAQQRSEFFKQGVFDRFSPGVLGFAGLGTWSGPEVVCFLPEKTGGVLRHNRAVVVREQA